MTMDQHLLDSLARRFDGRPYVPLCEAADMLVMSEPLLRDHVRDGAIQAVDIGRGHLRRKWMFRLADLAEFIEHQAQTPEPARAPCPSKSRATRHITTTSSRLVVTNFEALRAAKNAERLKRLSERSASK